MFSPILFSIYIDSLLKKQKDSGLGFPVGRIFAGAFGYADALVLISPSLSVSNLTFVSKVIEKVIPGMLKIRSWTLESHGVLCWVRECIACTPNLLVISFSGMECLTIAMQMTRSCI